MRHLLHPKRRRRRRRPKAEPLTPQAHADVLAAHADQKAQTLALKRRWAAEDALFRQAAQREGARRSARRPRSCMDEVCACKSDG
jgi:hypothetical protein